MEFRSLISNFNEWYCIILYIGNPWCFALIYIKILFLEISHSILL